MRPRRQPPHPLTLNSVEGWAEKQSPNPLILNLLKDGRKSNPLIRSS